MRVLFHALQAGNRSGTGRYTVELIKALATMEKGPTLVGLWPKGMPLPVETSSVEWVQYAAHFINRIFREQWDADRLARKYGVDIIHYPASVSSAGGVGRKVVTVHDLCYKTHPEWFPASKVLYYNAFLGAGIRAAAHIIADSTATAEDIIRFYGIPASRIAVIPLGVDACYHPVAASECERVRRRYNLPESYFLFVGTLEPRKNLMRVLAAWSRREGGVPDLVIVGRTGWKVTLKQYIQDKGYAEERIHCLGHVPASVLPALYTGATAFVWPSLMEGFGLPPLEAMACGTPVITSNTSSMPEVTGDAALLVSPTDVDALAKAMTRLVSEPQLRQQLQRAGRERAAVFTWKRTAEKTLEVYERVCRDSASVSRI